MAAAHRDDERLPHLESIRGVAALAVAIHHANVVFPVEPQWQWLHMTLRVIGNGGGGIFVFFILSGYVLTLSLERSGLRIPELAGYYIKRIFRLWPALIVSVVFTLIVLRIVRLDVVPSAGEVFVQWAASANSLADAIRNVFLISTRMNAPTWTIWTEVCWSALLPVMVYVSAKTGNLGRIIVGAGLVALHVMTPPTSFLNWGYLFFAGVCLTKMPPPPRPAFLLSIGVLTTFIGPRVFQGIDELSNACNAVGTFLILWTAVHNGGTLFAWGRHSWARFLGRISYSFYLIHMPVLIVCAYVLFRFPALFGISGDLIAIVGSVTCAVAIAFVMYWRVERPFLDLGRRLADKVTRLSTRISPTGAEPATS